MHEVEVRKRIGLGCDAFRENEGDLLRLGVGERTVAARLMLHLSRCFPEFDVDVEYNRAGVAPKRVNWAENSPDASVDLVLPDIVIHRRGSDASNLVVLEVKKSSATLLQLANDRAKLRAIRDVFRYSFAVAVLLTAPHAGSSADVECEFVM